MPSRRTFVTGMAAGAAALAAGTRLAQATQGVSKNEIVIGSIQDLSGPIVALGKPLRNGMLLRTEQINAAGGVLGRKLKTVVEDSGYDPKKGVLAAQKLLNQDRIFAMIGTLGTPVSLATIPLVIEKDVPHLFPITAHTGNFEPLHKLKFSLSNPYPNTTRIGLEQMLKMKPYKRIALIYQDDDYGLDVIRGTELALKNAGLQLVERTSYKRGATDFSSQMQKLKAANPDLIVLGTVVRETIGSMASARQLGYTGDFLGTEAAYQPMVAKAGGKAVEGLYAVSTVATPYRDDPANTKALNEWMDAYKERFGEDPDLYAVYGSMLVDIFARAAEQAGQNLTTDSFVQALEANGYPRTFFGNPEIHWTPTRRMGQDQARVAQIQNGRWTNVTEYAR